MLVFGIDIPLVELMFVFTLIIFILLIEAVVVIMLLINHLNRSKKITELLSKLSETILAIKQKEMEELTMLKGKK